MQLVFADLQCQVPVLVRRPQALTGRFYQLDSAKFMCDVSRKFFFGGDALTQVMQKHRKLDIPVTTQLYRLLQGHKRMQARINFRVMCLRLRYTK